MTFPEGLEGGLLLVLMPLLSPQGWDYVFLIATPAVVYLINYRDQTSRAWRVIIPITLLTIGLSLALNGDAVEMAIEDNGLPFDVSQAPAKPIGKPLEEVIPGGLGMQLIRSFSNEMYYEAMPGGNRTVLRFHRQPVA